MRAVHVRPPAQIEAGPGDVAVLGRAGGPVVHRFAELHAVPDPAAVVHRQHDEAAARQVLVHRVGVPVVVHVVPAGQHLPPRPAMKEDDGRATLTGLQVGGLEELGVDLQAVRGREGHGLGDDERSLRKLRRNRAGSQLAVGAASHAHHRGGMLFRPRADERDRIAVRDRHRRPLEIGALAERERLSAGHGDPPQVASLDVALVRAVEDGLAVRVHAHVLDLELSRREQRRRPPARADGIKVRPAVLLPREDDPFSVGPDELVRAHDLAEDAAAAGVGAERLARLAGGHVDDAYRPRRALAVRPQELPRGR